MPQTLVSPPPVLAGDPVQQATDTTAANNVQVAFAAPPPAAPAAKSTTAVIDFAGLPGVTGKEDYTFYVKLVTDNGTSYSRTYNIGAGTIQTVIRDMVMVDMVSAGFRASASGTTGILITGYVDGDQSAAISKVGASTKGLKSGEQPSISAGNGVQKGQTTDGTKWKFSLLSGDDGSTQVVQAGTIETTSIFDPTLYTPSTANLIAVIAASNLDDGSNVNLTEVPTVTLSGSV